jgi:hypothetical protein
MGLVHGHYDGGVTSADDKVQDDATIRRERVNMGIAIVVPANRILEIFDTPQMKEFFEISAKVVDEQLREKWEVQRALAEIEAKAKSNSTGGSRPPTQ